MSATKAAETNPAATASKTVQVSHPTISGLGYTVPAARSQEWADAGWKVTKTST